MSPRPRYQKLPEEKRRTILEAAAVEFGKHGFENASLNKIIARAGISKGATYYYFDDKADLYMTTILYYSQQLMGEISFDPAQLTAANFYDKIAELYRQQFTAYAERPWVFGVAKAGGAPPAELQEQEPQGRGLQERKETPCVCAASLPVWG